MSWRQWHEKRGLPWGFLALQKQGEGTTGGGGKEEEERRERRGRGKKRGTEKVKREGEGRGEEKRGGDRETNQKDSSWLWIARLSFLSHSKRKCKSREEKDRKERREARRRQTALPQ